MFFCVAVLESVHITGARNRKRQHVRTITRTLHTLHPQILETFTPLGIVDQSKEEWLMWLVRRGQRRCILVRCNQLQLGACIYSRQLPSKLFAPSKRTHTQHHPLQTPLQVKAEVLPWAYWNVMTKGYVPWCEAKNIAKRLNGGDKEAGFASSR